MTDTRNHVQLKRFQGFSQLCTMPETPSDADPLGIIEDATLVVAGDTVVWVGPTQAEPHEYSEAPVLDFHGRVALPGLVDCHTHVVYGGDRLEDFGRRTRGMSYEEILAGRGFGLEENRVAIETVSHIRNATPLGLSGDYHPFLKR